MTPAQKRNSQKIVRPANDRDAGAGIQTFESVIKNLVLVMSAGTFSVYTFTIGYIDVLKIPSTPSIIESLYFFLSLIVEHLAEKSIGLIPVVAIAWITFLILDRMITNGTYRKNIRYTENLLSRWRPKDSLVIITNTLFVISICSFQLLTQENRSYTISALFWDIKMFYPIDQNLFILTAVLNTFAPIFASLTLANNPFSKRHLVLQLLILLSCLSNSYKLAKYYSPFYITLPDIRVSSTSPTTYKLAWSTPTSKIILDCRFKYQIQVMEKENEQINYINLIDSQFSRALCERSNYAN